MANHRRNKLLERRWRTLWCSIVALTTISSVSVVECVGVEDGAVGLPSSPTELSGGIITRKRTVEKSSSPYVVREDVIVDYTGELVIEPGVEIRFAPMVGVTVRGGVLTAKGTQEEKIVLTSAIEPPKGPSLPDVRLVDGPSILAGRLQILHNGMWRSVCTNSRNWTLSDLEVVCRQLGFQGGSWWGWVDRQLGISQPRLLLEAPKCLGTETKLQECDWSSRQLGAGVCDYHPDLGVQCLPFHVTSTSVVQHWRGIRFLQAIYDRSLTLSNTLYVPVSRSQLSNIEIRFAGSGRDYNASSALHVEGVPPQMDAVMIANSAYNGINITSPSAPVTFNNCTFRNNRGYGVYVNGSTGGVLFNGCQVTENGADGIKYVHHEEIITKRNDIFDFCTFPTTGSQTFPITISLEQDLYSPNKKECSKYFVTKGDQVLTVHFLQTVADRNDSMSMQIYDGRSTNDNLLASISFRNSTRSQSVTTTRNTLYINFVAESFSEAVSLIRITSGYT